MLLNLLNSLQKETFTPTGWINSIKRAHSCKSLYICNKSSTHARFSISETREAFMQVLCICNKRSTHVRSSISAKRVALTEDPLYQQQEEHSCMILYVLLTEEIKLQLESKVEVVQVISSTNMKYADNRPASFSEASWYPGQTLT